MGPVQIENTIVENGANQNYNFREKIVSATTLQRQVAMPPDEIIEKMKRRSISETTISIGCTTTYVLKYAPDFRAPGTSVPLYGKQQCMSSLVSTAESV